MRRKPLNGSHVSQSLCTDDGKRRLFIQNFTAPDLTAELIESVENSSSSWDAMVDQLCRRLIRRTIHATAVVRGKACQTLMCVPSEPLCAPVPTSSNASFADFDLSSHSSIMNDMNSPAFSMPFQWIGKWASSSGANSLRT